MPRARKPVTEILPETVGLWRIVGEAEDHIADNGRPWRMAECQCSGCGKRRKVLIDNLRRNYTLGCRTCRPGGRPRKEIEPLPREGQDWEE